MSQAPVELRLAAPADAAELATVFAETCRHAYQHILPPSFLARYVPSVQVPRWTKHLDELPPSHRLTLAWQEGRIIGFVEVSHGRPDKEGSTIGNLTVADPARVGEVDYLFVHPPSIGTGVGRLLLSTGESWLAEMGVDVAIIWVFSANTSARRFYDRFGWKFTGHEQLEPELLKDEVSVRECLYRKTGLT
jgi:GNAT superfamily N-acetyltransferase